MQQIVSGPFWKCAVGIALMNGSTKQSSVHNQMLTPLLRLRGKEKNDGSHLQCKHCLFKLH